MFRLFTSLIFFLSVLPFAYGEAIGVTRLAHTQVRSDFGGTQRILASLDQVYSDEHLRSDAQGNAQIELLDGTKIVVGPNADLRLDDFVYGKNNTISALTVRAAKGAFRFISGRSGHGAYKVVTPQGTIGVRGTAFDVSIKREGLYVALLAGEVQVCDRNRRCRDLTEPCNYVFLNGRGGSSGNRLSQLASAKVGEVFPLLKRQERLLPGFKRYTSSCIVNELDSRAASLPAPAPSVQPPAPSVPSVGNPGNGKSVGNAGPSPNGSDFGGPTNGRSDSAGKGNNNGVGNGRSAG